MKKKKQRKTHFGPWKELGRRTTDMILVTAGRAGAYAQAVYEIHRERRVGNVTEIEYTYERGHAYRSHEANNTISHMLHAAALLNAGLLRLCEENDAAIAARSKRKR